MKGSKVYLTHPAKREPQTFATIPGRSRKPATVAETASTACQYRGRL